MQKNNHHIIQFQMDSQLARWHSTLQMNRLDSINLDAYCVYKRTDVSVVTWIMVSLGHLYLDRSWTMHYKYPNDK